MAYIRTFRDLEVYRQARELSKKIFILTKDLPVEEKYSLTSQIRRSSRSVGAQIAEAWAKRMYKKHFISKLTDADGEQKETQHWIETSFDCDYISSEVSQELLNGYSGIGRMLNAMMVKADTFCDRAK